LHIKYISCPNACGYKNSCILKCVIENNILKSIQPCNYQDETLANNISKGTNIVNSKTNSNVNGKTSSNVCGKGSQGRQGSFNNCNSYKQVPCPIGRAWRKTIYAKNRITKPQKRVGNRGFGEGYFIDISWEQALRTIAEQMAKIQSRYGSASIYCNHKINNNESSLPFANCFDAAIRSKETISTHKPLAIGRHLCNEILLNNSNNSTQIQTTDADTQSEQADIRNAKLIILWCEDLLVQNYGILSHHCKLAHENGTKVVALEPRYSASAEFLADQWLPIKPNSSLAIILAIAYVLFENHRNLHKYLQGISGNVALRKWYKHLNGADDGIVKTPEWAESISALPAQTIRALANLCGKYPTVHLISAPNLDSASIESLLLNAALLLESISCAIQSPSEAALFLNPAAANIGFSAENTVAAKEAKSGDTAAKASKEQSKERSMEDFLPASTKMLILDGWNQSQQINTKNMLRTMLETEFNWGFYSFSEQFGYEYMDIVLPAPILPFESTDALHPDFGRFVLNVNDNQSYLLFCDKVLQPPAGVRAKDWVWTDLAKRLGIADKYNPKMLDASWREWDNAVRERIYQPMYQKWCSDVENNADAQGAKLPSWSEFIRKPIVNIGLAGDLSIAPSSNSDAAPSSDSNAAPSSNSDAAPSSDSGSHLLEIAAKRIAMPHWQDANAGKPAVAVKQRCYPLILLIYSSIYRQQNGANNNLWLKHDCYRHSVWISLSDALKRNIADGDICELYSEQATSLLPAYVSERIVPGAVAIYKGASFWPLPSSKSSDNPFGIDTNGDGNLFLNAKDINAKVEVRKYLGRLA
jgi:anaerobic dimethyl sulfoxide reductase subunit A